MAALVSSRWVVIGFKVSRNRMLGICGRIDKKIGSAFITDQQIATIVSPAAYRPKTDKPKPWPYEQKTFNVLDQMLGDSTEARLDENSKVIVVDGNIAVGKSKFAQELAKVLEFHYVPPVTERDIFYVKEADLDLRWLNHALPKEHHYYDLTSWLKDQHPEEGLGGKLQLQFYIRKIYKYAHGLHHLLSTGQGVVFDGSPFSDQAFADAMYACGWISRPALKYYLEFKRQTIFDMWKPHLTIYLDAPVSFVRKNLKERNHPVEKGSKVLTAKFVTEIDNSFKNNILPVLKKYGEVLVYDASDMEKLDVVVEDIERLNLDWDVNDDHKFKQWYENKAEDLLSYFRRYYGSQHELMKLFNLPLPWHVPAMMDSPETCTARRRAYESLDRTKYAKGFNPRKDDLWYILSR